MISTFLSMPVDITTSGMKAHFQNTFLFLKWIGIKL